MRAWACTKLKMWLWASTKLKMSAEANFENGQVCVCKVSVIDITVKIPQYFWQ